MNTFFVLLNLGSKGRAYAAAMNAALNIHPLFVHFPIAFLSLASVMELTRFKALTRQGWWLPMKTILLVVGVIWAFAAGTTGEMAEQAFRGTDTMHVVETHSLFAGIATYAYLALALAMLLQWTRRAGLAARMKPGIGRWLAKAESLFDAIFQPPVAIFVSLVAFGALLVTGALGASIVYGQNVDPFVQIIYFFVIGE